MCGQDDDIIRKLSLRPFISLGEQDSLQQAARKRGRQCGLQRLDGSPELQALNPEPLSPELKALNPELQPLSPELQPLSPELQALNPELQPLSPELQALNPELQALNPELQPLSPKLRPELSWLEPGETKPNVFGTFQWSL
uniref:Uncharacterized protein n=1 Tax=Electrophorus electricus TaxID=8005 RepID=A0AAY5EI79_ELEEL